MAIQTQSADGVTHEFPDGTPDAVIDRAMKTYATGQAAPPKETPSLLSALGQGAANLIPHSIDASMKLLGAGDAARQFGENLASPTKREALVAALKQGAQHAGGTIGGYVQQLRDLSPPESQGSAPRMDTAPAQQAEGSIVNSLGVNVSPARVSQALQGQNLGQPNANAYNTAKTQVAEHPLSVLATVGTPFAGKAVGMGADALEASGLALPKLSVPNAIKGTGQRIASVLDAGATPAAENVRSAALAKILTQQKAASDAATQAEALKAADKPLRSAMEAAAQAQADKGIAISDIPEAKALVASLEKKVNPTGEVGTVLLPDQAKPYQQIIDTLSPQNGVRPNLESIQNLRRAIAKPAFTGDQAGYNAIPKGDRKDLVRSLNALEDAYTGGLQAPVQTNYAKMLDAAQQAKDAEKIAPDLMIAATKLDTLSAKDSITTAQGIVDKLAKKQLIGSDEYAEFRQLAQAATDAQGKAAFRKKLALYGLGTAGVVEGGRLAGHATGILP